MISLQSRAIPQSTDCSFPKDIFLLKEFKALLNEQIKLLGLAKRFRPRLYTWADFVFPKLYALTRQISVHVASEGLNAFLVRHYKSKYRLQPKRFQDKVRHRRFIPHQTDVDKFFRRLSKKKFKISLEISIWPSVARSLLSLVLLKNGDSWSIIRNILIMVQLRPRMNRRPSSVTWCIKTVRMFQGHSTHCQNITLFTDFYLLQKGVGRWLSIPNSVDWLKFNNFGFNYGLMDREFYRA
ncbi:hypothetical protein [Candidatus Lokiarchaeum ossiferum]|uniref:hypothetical protein n=1 Tax=Candidatus Lokiarchaeum ossiferum TaxID=2951803 RepID=UPI00352FE19F